MGLAHDFRIAFEGVTFSFIENSGGVGKFRSDFIEIPESNQEVFFEIIVSLKDNFQLPVVVLIQDIYNASEKIHDISQFQNVPIKTHNLFNRTNEKAI